MPYQRDIKLMTLSLVTCIIHSINYLPQKCSIIKRIGANTILLVKTDPNFNMKITFFGSYAMVYTGTKNNMSCISIPGVASRESNEDGGHFFIYLYTIFLCLCLPLQSGNTATVHIRHPNLWSRNENLLMDNVIIISISL